MISISELSSGFGPLLFYIIYTETKTSSSSIIQGSMFLFGACITLLAGIVIAIGVRPASIRMYHPSGEVCREGEEGESVKQIMVDEGLVVRATVGHRHPMVMDDDVDDLMEPLV